MSRTGPKAGCRAGITLASSEFVFSEVGMPGITRRFSHFVYGVIQSGATVAMAAANRELKRRISAKLRKQPAEEKFCRSTRGRVPRPFWDFSQVAFSTKAGKLSS